MKKRCVIIVLGVVCLLVSPLTALGISLADFQALLPSDSDAAFLAADKRDLSRFQTPPKHQDPTGACTTFSMVAAIEAAYTRKYCTSADSSWMRDNGYCGRYDAINKSLLTYFYFVDNPLAFTRYRCLDLSEIYFIHRVLTQWVASPSATHESGNSFHFLDGMERTVTGNVDFMVENLRLPPEASVPWIYDSDFWAVQAPNAIADGGITQDNIDSVEFTERQFTFNDKSGSPISRAWIPLAGRQQAQFGATDMLVVRAANVGDKIKFLEKTIYAGYEVALDGAAPGHSMLLVGYDRTAKKFYYKDHYEDFQLVDYSVTESNANTFSVVTDVPDPTPDAYAEEMWIGTWDMDLDGRMGRLVIRRMRIPPNALYATEDLTGINLVAASTDKWARVGSFFESDGSKHVAYGRVTPYGGGILELYINFDEEEGPPDPLAEVAAGYTPVGQYFLLRIFAVNKGTAIYATGYTIWGNNRYGVVLQRPDHAPYNVIPHHSTDSFDRDKWLGRFRLRLHDGGLATMTLSAGATGDTLSGTLLWPGVSGATPFTATFNADNDISFGSYNDPFGSIRMNYLTWEDGVLAGSSKVGMLGTPMPFYGVAIPLVTVRATDSTAAEPKPGMRANPGVFTFSRTGELNIDVSVRYSLATGEGYATNGVDYVKLPGRITIPAGSASVKLTVRPLADTLEEGTEQVELRLVGSPAYVVGKRYSSAIVNIVDAQ